MARLGSTTSVRAREMRGVLARWERSGLTLSEFARRNGMAASTLGWWRHVFQKREQAKLGGRRARARFIEIKPERPALVTPAVLEVVLRSGQVVRVPPGFDVARLREVVLALDAPC